MTGENPEQYDECLDFEDVVMQYCFLNDLLAPITSDRVLTEGLVGYFTVGEARFSKLVYCVGLKMPILRLGIELAAHVLPPNSRLTSRDEARMIAEQVAELIPEQPSTIMMESGKMDEIDFHHQLTEELVARFPGIGLIRRRVNI